MDTKKKRRVVITGIGTVNPTGNTVAESWAAIKAGRCAVGPITAFDTTDFKVKLAAEVKDFDPVSYTHLQAPAAHHFFCQWRRTDAGGHFQPDADGQNQRCAGTVQPQRRVVHQRADSPHHRRSYGKRCV